MGADLKTLTHQEMLDVMPDGSRFQRLANPSALGDYLIRRFADLPASQLGLPTPCRIAGGLGFLDFHGPGLGALTVTTGQAEESLRSMFRRINEVEANGGYLANSDHRITEPTPMDLATNFAAATSKWALAGFPIVSRAVYEARSAICSSCPMWDQKARLGLGKCRDRACGCTRFKQWLSTEKCPQGKWPSTS